MFFWPLFGCGVAVPLLMLFFGHLLSKRPPKTSNPFVGFRTRRAMRNTQTWLFAQVYAGKLWFKVGCVMLPISAIAFLPAYGMVQEEMAAVALIIFLVQMMGFFIAWPLTERALKENFTESGQPKNVKRKECGL